ncbi:MAG: hypothetical protein ACM3TR_08085 [Caulobacteraceae bacterium]
MADTLPDKEGYNLLLKFGMAANSDGRLIPSDEGRNISFVRVIARKK